jgi:hypothetical protein
MFEIATRNKFRFNYKGLCSVEDLWDLSVKALDSIFKELNSNLKQQKEESLLDVKTASDEVLDLKITIVKYIVEIKLAEKVAKENAAFKAAHKQKLMGIIETKQDDALHNMSVEDLTKLMENL